MSNSVSVSITRNAAGDIVSNETPSTEFNPEANHERATASGLSARPQTGVVTARVGGAGDVSTSTIVRTSVNSSDLVEAAKAANPGSILATAVSPLGFPVAGSAVNENSLVDVGGMQVTVKVAQNMNLITRVNGEYADSGDKSSIEPAPQAPAAEVNPNQLPSIQQQIITSATMGLPSVAANHLLVKAMMGTASEQDYRHMAEQNGIDTDTLMANFNAAASGAYGFIASKLGTTLEHLGEVLDEVESQNSAEAVGIAMRELVAGGDTSKFMALAEYAARTLPPSTEQLEDAGYKTMTDRTTGEAMVWIEDGDSAQWVPIRVAARISLI